MENAKQKMKDFVKFGSMNIAISYKYWDYNDKRMFEVEKISYDEKGNHKVVYARFGDGTSLRDPDNGEIIPSTMLYDMGNREIHMGDIVICDFLDDVYKERVVFWDNGWRVMGATTEEFKVMCEDHVKIVGDMWQSPELYNTYRTKYDDVLK